MMSKCKMSDIYKLPMLCEDGDGHLYSRDCRHEIIFDDTDVNCMEQKSAVAHAINNHDRLTAQVEELKEMLEKLTARGVEYLNDEDLNDDEDRAAIESNFNDKILESRKLLTRIGDKDA